MGQSRSRVAREGLRAERESSRIYAALAVRETGESARLFGRLRAACDRQAERWETILREAGEPVPVIPSRTRVILVIALIRLLGARRILPVLGAMKVRGLGLYRGSASHAGAAPRVSVAPASADERWHRTTSEGGTLRAAVFGMNDGLVSNASLIMGVAGAEIAPHNVVIAGAAGLLAGGFSMAAGEYVSVKTQREMFERQMSFEREELEFMPEEEAAELASIYEAKGIPAAQARELANQLIADPEMALDTLAREELGLDPNALGAPLAAAGASFASFAVGAAIPLLPYLILTPEAAFVTAILTTGIALLAVGALLSLFTGRRAWWSASRMLLIGGTAAAVTYLMGSLLGVTVS